MNILLTNDDGIDAPGLAAIHAQLVKLGDVTVVAPFSEMSAVGHGITISEPLKVHNVMRDGSLFGYGIGGTPADCVKLAIQAIMETPPDLVVSGINRGENIGLNALYSGTVSAAMEALMQGYSAIALSVNKYLDPDYRAAARFGAALAQRVLDSGEHLDCVLNVNCPSVPINQISGACFARQGRSRIVDDFVRKTDPRGNVYYWQGGMTQNLDHEPDVDAVCLENGMIAVTPLHYSRGVVLDDARLAEIDLKGIFCGSCAS